MTEITIENLQKAGWQLETEEGVRSYLPITKILEDRQEGGEYENALLGVVRDFGGELFSLILPNHNAQIVLNIQSMEDLEALERIFGWVTDWY